MRLRDGALRYSATDVSNFASCRHLTDLELAAVAGLVSRPHQHGLGLEALAERGTDHERRVLQGFRDRGWSVVEVDEPDDAVAQQVTRVALERGADVVYQGVLQTGPRYGRPDFLVRAALLGGGDGHEVVDAKLARSAKAAAVLQATFYSRQLAEVQGEAPKHLHLALGDRRLVPFRVAALAAYERQVDAMFRDATAAEPAFPVVDTYPDPNEHCVSCRWSRTCATRRRGDDDLSLVAGISARQRGALQAAGIPTRRALAAAETLTAVDGAGSEGLERLRAQARLQVAAEDDGRPRWELIAPERDSDGALVPDRGLLALPEPAPGDLFFDIEGARFWSDDAGEFGLQYLFGIVDSAELDDAETPVYHAFWATDRASEKRAFQAVIDFIAERVATRPGAHVYHYNHYEPTTMGHLADAHQTRTEVLGRLMGRHATREDEVDDLLRREVFVDLYRVVRQGVRASVESYSIKRLEPLCGFRRSVELAALNEEMIRFEVDLDRGHAVLDSPRAETVRGYNEDDCRSTLALRDWLEACRGELAASLGDPLPRPTVPERPVTTADADVVALHDRLLDGLPDDVRARSDVGSARALLADLLDYFRRDDKPMWWRYFHLRGLTDEQLLEQPDAMSGMRFAGTGEPVKKSTVFLYEFPEQEHGIRPGDTVDDPRLESGGRYDVHSVDESASTIGLLRSAARHTLPHPTALIPFDHVPRPHHAAALRELAVQLLDDGLSPRLTAVMDLLLRRLPRTSGRAPLPVDPPDIVGSAVALCGGLRDSMLPVQGPPGAGKTYLGVEQILALVDAGARVGITAGSHAVIGHLLAALDDAATARGRPITIGQRAPKGSTGHHPGAQRLTDTGAAVAALASGDLQVVGATTWLWANPDLRDAVHTLVVDEAGQIGLADTLAASLAASNLVLLGDPLQLSNVSQGTHPPGCAVSALEHVLGDAATMPDDRGVFLDRTRRMHPAITRFISEAFYEDRLQGIEGLERQAILSDGPVSGSGLRLVDVVHSGNGNAAPEEADVVARLVADLLRRRWRQADDTVLPLTPADILVVTPFNAQIRLIDRALGAAGISGIAVGTVDRFQGREAAAVVYSMASSTAADAPRGLEFLYDPHRLNVAVSRARCLAVLVSSPDLARATCRTPRQIELVSALCRFRELAEPVSLNLAAEVL
jgi:predicted RecB family nuclease